MFRPRCWSGRNSTFPARPRPTLAQRPVKGPLGIGGRADGAAVAAGERLDVSRGVHVRDRDHGFGQAQVLQRLPALLNLLVGGHVGHGAAGGQVRQDHCLGIGGQDVGRLGHEVHTAEDHEFGFRPRRRILGQLEGVAGHVGEPDHFIALVVMAKDERAIAQRGARPLGPAHEVRVGLRRQLARTSDPALGAGIGACAQHEQRKLASQSRSFLVLVRQCEPRGRPPGTPRDVMVSCAALDMWSSLRQFYRRSDDSKLIVGLTIPTGYGCCLP